MIPLDILYVSDNFDCFFQFQAAALAQRGESMKSGNKKRSKPMNLGQFVVFCADRKGRRGFLADESIEEE
jgi:hypothetical protein